MSNSELEKTKDLASKIYDALGRPHGLLRASAKIANAVVIREYDEAHSLISSFENSDKSKIRAISNSQILYERQKEWTSHGINRTFRFWSFSEKAEYLEFANKVINCLQPEYKATLGFGSVLSIVRDGDLIPHDDDLDIIACRKIGDVSKYNEVMTELVNHLVSQGYEVRGNYVAHRHVSNGRFMVDVFLGLQTGDYVSWHPGPRGVLAVEDIFPPQEVTCLGEVCSIPAKAERYLEVVYGDDWRTPAPGWSHDFNPEKYKDWFWPSEPKNKDMKRRGDLNLERFILLTNGRAGSNFVMSALNQVEDVYCASEILHPIPNNRPSVGGVRWDGVTEPDKFLVNTIFKPTGSVAAAGFKLSFFHAREFTGFWQYIEEDTDIKIIFLRRENRLARFLSEQRARHTKLWHPAGENDKKYLDNVELELDIEALARSLESQKKYDEKAKHLIANKKHYTTSYEQISEDPKSAISDILQLLGVGGHREFSVAFSPSSVSHSHTTILNRTAVAEVLSETGDAWMLDALG